MERESQKDMLIGQMLVESKAITPMQLQIALNLQENPKENPNRLRLGEFLLKLNYLSEEKLIQVLSGRLRVPVVDLSAAAVDPAAVSCIPEAFARAHCCIAYQREEGRLFIAVDDPVNFYFMDELKALTGLEIESRLCAKSMIMETLETAYAQFAVSAAIHHMHQVFNDDHENEPVMENVENAPVVKLVNTMIETAYRKDASDIHIEPGRKETQIRIRIHGSLCRMMTVKQTAHSALITRLKILSGMNIAEKRMPLDGRFSLQIEDKELDIRVSTIPTIYGEKAVLRLFTIAGKRLMRIDELGMTEAQYAVFSKIIHSPHGILLVTGPTGSGKTTTLYAALQELASPSVNIVTLEDPVEKRLDAVNQVQMNEKGKLTFASVLRSVLRQDPDIIMVGEIRDGETAEIAIRAAITGHLVCSTLHTNDAASTIMRLLDMGVPPYLLAGSLIGVIAQRLVKLLCDGCKERYLLTALPELHLLGQTEPVAVCRASETGCRLCSYTGYQGRTAIYELLIPSDAVRQMIHQNSNVHEIGQRAAKDGMRLLGEAASDLALAGRIDMTDLTRAAYTI